jgi:uncharacterized membrane protein SirB2
MLADLLLLVNGLAFIGCHAAYNIEKSQSWAFWALAIYIILQAVAAGPRRFAEKNTNTDANT